MPALPTLGLFMLAALGLLLFPGPSVLYVVTRSASQGRRAGLASVMGIESAGFVHTAAAAFGLSALLLTSALAFDVVKYVGAAYLIFLGLRTLLSRHQQEQSLEATPRSFRQLYSQGFLVNLLNPKTALFFYAFLPQFVDPTRGAVVAQIVILGALFVVLATCTDGLYALLGASVGRVLTRNARVQRWQRYFSGVVYIVLGATAAVAGTDRK
jgi:threonine/homoserine/homoserine lactone efflux protein